MSTKRLSKRELELGRLLYPEDEHADVERPRTRGDCSSVPRPCPFVACKHHLFLDVLPTGGLKMNFPDLEPWELPADGSCTLDVAEREGVTLEEIGGLMNLTRERVRQLEGMATAQLRRSTPFGQLREDYFPKRRLPVVRDQRGEESGVFDVERFVSDELDIG